ncbi:hypothetical protein ACHAWC_010925 [Mediolabrus comicus]
MNGTSASSESILRRRRAVNGENDDNDNDVSTNTNGSVNNNSRDNDEIENIILEYKSACEVYGCSNRINAGVLTTLRFQLPSLRVSGSFFDADMLALVEILLHHVNGALSYIRRLDFSVAALEGKNLGKKGIRSHGAYALSKVLQISLHIEEVFLPKNKIGPYGASAIFCAARENKALRTLLMRGCRIGERGAFALVSQILMNEDASNMCGLKEVDLSVNQIGFYGVYAIEKGLKNRRERLKALGVDDKDILVEIDLEGNMVFQEVMNCVTHGLGILLATIGTVLLSSKVKGMERHYKLSCAVYSTSLIVLYLSSTLYHSFFALQRTSIHMDMCTKWHRSGGILSSVEIQADIFIGNVSRDGMVVYGLYARFSGNASNEWIVSTSRWRCRIYKWSAILREEQ